MGYSTMKGRDKIQDDLQAQRTIKHLPDQSQIHWLSLHKASPALSNDNLYGFKFITIMLGLPISGRTTQKTVAKFNLNWFCHGQSIVRMALCHTNKRLPLQNPFLADPWSPVNKVNIKKYEHVWTTYNNGLRSHLTWSSQICMMLLSYKTTTIIYCNQAVYSSCNVNISQPFHKTRLPLLPGGFKVKVDELRYWTQWGQLRQWRTYQTFSEVRKHGGNVIKRWNYHWELWSWDMHIVTFYIDITSYKIQQSIFTVYILKIEGTQHTTKLRYNV